MNWRALGWFALPGLLALAAQAQPATAHQGHGAAASMAKAARPKLGGSAAFAPDGRLWWVGLDAQGRLVQQSTADLRQWNAPRVLATGGDAIAADGENRPKLAFGPQGQVVVSYTQPLDQPFTGQVRLLRSVDAGKTFAAPVTVHADRQEITHRFESIAFDTQGVLHTVWIDKRDLEAAPKVGRKSTYRGAALYRNESHDGGLTFGPDIKLADHSCECCRIALAPDAQGRLHAMWRHVFEPNVRDHALAALAGGAAVVRASFDDWAIDACPHHGPGLASASDGGWHAVWFGIRREGAEDVAAVRYARLQADGSPRAQTVRALPDEAAEHADVAAHGERVAVVWRSVQGARSTLKAWLSRDGGHHFEMRELAQVQGENDHPRLAQQGARLVVVWRTVQEVQAHELRF